MKITEIDEILKLENERATMEQARRIYLYPDGIFMRALEWSAYLWCKYIKDFRPMHRKTKKAGETIIQIGCPIDKVANHLAEGAEYVQNDDGSAVITLPPAAIPDDTDLAALAAEIDKWKAAVPDSDDKEQKKKFTPGGIPREILEGHPATITSIMQQILAFPIETKSLMDCAMFLSDMKKQLARLV